MGQKITRMTEGDLRRYIKKVILSEMFLPAPAELVYENQDLDLAVYNPRNAIDAKRLINDYNFGMPRWDFEYWFDAEVLIFYIFSDFEGEPSTKNQIAILVQDNKIDLSIDMLNRSLSEFELEDYFGPDEWAIISNRILNYYRETMRQLKN